MENKHPLLLEIEKGESKNLEFKVQLPTSKEWVKSIISFANSAGGKLVIGVSDNRTLIGLQHFDLFELMDKISSTMHELVAPTLLPNIYIENINGIELLVIEVQRGALLPYYLKSKGKELGCYQRIGATNRVVSQAQVIELERQRNHISFDSLINYEVDLSTLDLTPLQQRFAAHGKPLTPEKLLSLKLVKNDNNTLYPTHGLLILLGFYEHVEIKCSRFKGNTMSIFLDKKEYTGDLFQQIENAELFIKNHLHLRAEVLGLQRIDTFEIPFPAIREALLNAVMHRDYSNFGRDIKIGIYDDIVNIVSPGGLPHGLTMHDALKGRSEIRNTVIARVFKELDLVEQWGSGIQRIKEYCTKANTGLPVFSESGDFIDWEFPRKTHQSNEVLAINDGINDGISDGISDGI
ncbi:putative DNA binding domain-containing protein, partial [Pseudoalteromonas sp. SG41-5]|uniref:ATP-binding protein n=1 Tax=Pseudoalteromonas sp. SG41-5 TaxID=2760975 RepID=UPI001601F1E5